MVDDKEIFNLSRSCKIFTYSPLNSLQIDPGSKIACFLGGQTLALQEKFYSDMDKSARRETN